MVRHGYAAIALAKVGPGLLPGMLCVLTPQTRCLNESHVAMVSKQKQRSAVGQDEQEAEAGLSAQQVLQ